MSAWKEDLGGSDPQHGWIWARTYGPIFLFQEVTLQHDWSFAVAKWWAPAELEYPWVVDTSGVEMSRSGWLDSCFVVLAYGKA